MEPQQSAITSVVMSPQPVDVSPSQLATTPLQGNVGPLPLGPPVTAPHRSNSLPAASPSPYCFEQSSSAYFDSPFADPYTCGYPPRSPSWSARSSTPELSPQDTMFRVFQGQLMDLRRDLFVQLDSLNKNLHDLRMDVLRRGKKKHPIFMPSDEEKPQERPQERPLDDPKVAGGEGGVWFGDPRSHISEGRKVWIEGVDADKVVSAETLSPSPDKLAVNLLMVLFSMTEVASGNCTTPKRSDIHLLDQKMIGAIRLHLNYRFPTDPGTENTRWRRILQRKLNAKCRGLRPKGEDS